MKKVFKQRISELEIVLEKYSALMKKDKDYVIKCRYKFCLEIYQLNIYLLGENYSPRFK